MNLLYALGVDFDDVDLAAGGVGAQAVTSASQHLIETRSGIRDKQ